MEKQDLILKKRVFQNSDSLLSFHGTERNSDDAYTQTIFFV